MAHSEDPDQMLNSVMFDLCCTVCSGSSVQTLWVKYGKMSLISTEKWMPWVCVFVLRYYSPVNPLGSCLALSVYLTTHFPGQAWSSKWLTSTLEDSFAANGREWP